LLPLLLQKMYLVMELCDGGELSGVLREHGPFSEEATRSVVEQLARAVSYLHKRGNCPNARGGHKD